VPDEQAGSAAVRARHKLCAQQELAELGKLANEQRGPRVLHRGPKGVLGLSL
jgi:hypothetical protein